MDAARLFAHLARFPGVLRELLAGLEEEEVRFRPAAGMWSILEIVSHLADEERLDFRPRLERTLRNVTEAWEPIAPEEWVSAHRYDEGEIGEMLERFCREREASLAWCHGLAAPDWSNTHPHPHLGPLRAGDLLVSWTVHDHLHHRQITARLHELARAAGGEYSSRYAEP